MAICRNRKTTVGSGQGKGTAFVANYHTKLCPICLEYFDDAPWDKMEEASYSMAAITKIRGKVAAQ
jgi:hypothetical protein